MLEIYLSKLDRKRRDDFKRIKNKIERELGDCKLEIFKDVEYYEKFVEMHKQEWSEKKDPSIFGIQKYYEYYKDVVKILYQFHLIFWI